MPNKELTTAAAETLEDGAIQVEVTLSVRPRRRDSANSGQPGSVPDVLSRWRIPRITRLMALAIKFEAMVGRGEVCDYADLARLGYVTRARITQIMNLLNLAPNIQEELLTRTVCSPQIFERQLRVVTSQVLWQQQRLLWHSMSPPSVHQHPGNGFKKPL